MSDPALSPATAHRDTVTQGWARVAGVSLVVLWGLGVVLALAVTAPAATAPDATGPEATADAMPAAHVDVPPGDGAPTLQSAGTGSISSTQAVAESEPTTFTLGELHDGEVTAARFAAFWDAELERIRSAPCPGPVAAGTTVVTAFVGATPPTHLGDAYRDYAPLLADARAQAAAECSSSDTG